MLVIGGGYASSSETRGVVRDPWTNGLGIFDLTALTWLESFNASAESYKQPSIVQQYYASK
jgi:hypothetical protein